MKRIISVLLALCLTLALVACGSKEAKTEGTGESETDKTEVSTDNLDDESEAQGGEILFPMPDIIIGDKTLTLGKTTVEDMAWYMEKYNTHIGEELYRQGGDGTNKLELSYAPVSYEKEPVSVHFSSFGAMPYWKDMACVRTAYLKENSDKYVETDGDNTNVDAYFLQRAFDFSEEELDEYVKACEKKELTDDGRIFFGFHTMTGDGYIPAYDPSHFVLSNVFFNDAAEESEKAVLSTNGFHIGSDEQEVKEYYGFDKYEGLNLATDFDRDQYLLEDTYGFSYCAPNHEYNIQFGFTDGKVSDISIEYNENTRMEKTRYYNIDKTQEEIAAEEAFLRDGHTAYLRENGEKLPVEFSYDKDIMDLDLFVKVDGYSIVPRRSLTTPVDEYIGSLDIFGESYSYSESLPNNSGDHDTYTVTSRDNAEYDIISLVSYYECGIPYIVGFKYGFATNGRSGSDFHTTSIELPKGITDKSTASEVIEAFGKPSKSYIDSDAGIQWYAWCSSQTKFVRLAFEGLDPDTAVMSDIYVFAGPASTKLATAISDEAIGFMHSYK